MIVETLSKIENNPITEVPLIEIVKHDQVRFFTLSQAQEILPLVYRLTEESAREVRYLMACIEALPDKKSACPGPAGESRGQCPRR